MLGQASGGLTGEYFFEGLPVPEQQPWYIMTHSFLAQAADPISYWPLGILAISVGFIVFTIIKLKLHPFLALIFAAVLTGLLTGDLPGMTTENVGLFKSRVALNDTPTDTANDMLLAVNWSLLGFGNTAAGIGFVVALAAIIGTCMLGSGAADRVVRWLLGIFGEKRAGLVLLMSGFLLSIPVFFDTVFFLLIPLARALSLRTGKSYTLYVIAMAGAGAITHSMVPPTPGPLMIADGLQLDLGIAMMAGLAASLLPAWLVLFWPSGSTPSSTFQCGRRPGHRRVSFGRLWIKKIPSSLTCSCRLCQSHCRWC